MKQKKTRKTVNKTLLFKIGIKMLKDSVRGEKGEPQKNLELALFFKKSKILKRNSLRQT